MAGGFAWVRITMDMLELTFLVRCANGMMIASLVVSRRLSSFTSGTTPTMVIHGLGYG